jgi:hypothetical protein
MWLCNEQDSVIANPLLLPPSLSRTRAGYMNYNKVDLDWYWDLFAQDYSHDKLQSHGNSLALAAS